MAMLMIGEVPNLAEEIYAGMIGQMMPLMRAHIPPDVVPNRQYFPLHTAFTK